MYTINTAISRNVCNWLQTHIKAVTIGSLGMVL